MRLLLKKIYLIILSTSILFLSTTSWLQANTSNYTKKDVSNYLSGIISSDQNNHSKAYKHFNETQFLKKEHKKFNIQYIYTLILLEKFKESVVFSKSIWKENELFFELDLILGIDYFIKNDYVKAEEHFNRLRINKNTGYEDVKFTDLIFKDFLGDILKIWVKASTNDKESAYKILNSIPERYHTLTKIQKNFLNCYFDLPETENFLRETIDKDENNFPRYNFFLTNHLIFKNKIKEAEKVISSSRIKNSSNLLLKQTEKLIINKKEIKIKDFFDCKDPKDNIAENFYIMANLYSTQDNYNLSNFYLKIALFLNSEFQPYKALLAENYYFQKKFVLSQKNFNSIKSIGSVYSWYAAKNIVRIKLKKSDNKSDRKKIIDSLQKELNSLSKPDFEDYFELANFYNENEYYDKSIKYYSLALKDVEKKNFLISKILYRRGTSYERLGEWEKAERDFNESLNISPNNPDVLNYLAYSWIEKNKNVSKALKMLVLADKLKSNNGYITDSLGWAYYKNREYVKAENFLRKAIALMPLDETINDHYADILWKLNKKIQARYFWSYVLNLENIDTALKEKINKKLLFGIE